MGSKLSTVWIGAALAVLLPSTAWAADREVPGQFRTIKRALRAAGPGDRVIVTGGAHKAKFKIKRRDVIVQGQDGAVLRNGKVKIKGNGATLRGFVLDGVSILVKGDDVTVKDNEFLSAHRKATHTIQVKADRVRVDGNEVVAAETAAKRRRAAIHVNGNGGIVEDNDVTAFRRGIDYSGHGAQIVGNTVDAGQIGISVRGGVAFVNTNVVPSPPGPAKTADETCGILIDGEDAIVSDNTVGHFDGIRIDGDDAQVVGNDSLPGSDTGAFVIGEGAVFRDNRLNGTNQAIYVDGPHPTIELNELGTLADRPDFAVTIFADDAVVDANTIFGGERAVEVVGSGADVCDNFVDSALNGIVLFGDDITVRDNTVDTQEEAGAAVSVEGDRATVRANVIGGSEADANGVQVYGSDAMVTENETSRTNIAAVVVEGDGAVIERNSTTFAWVGVNLYGQDGRIADNTILANGPVDPFSCAMLVVATGPGVVIEDNRVTYDGGDGIYAEGDGMVICDNRIRTAGFGWTEEEVLNAVYLVGNGNTIENNDNPVGFGKGGVAVEGNDNVMDGNTFTGDGFDGVVVWGDGNEICSANVNGFQVCGIYVEGLANKVIDCVIEDCDFVGLVNFGTNTEVRNTTVSGSPDGDVLNTGDFLVFDTVTFGTMFEGNEANAILAQDTRDVFTPRE